MQRPHPLDVRSRERLLTIQIRAETYRARRNAFNNTATRNVGGSQVIGKTPDLLQANDRDLSIATDARSRCAGPHYDVLAARKLSCAFRAAAAMRRGEHRDMPLLACRRGRTASARRAVTRSDLRRFVE